MDKGTLYNFFAGSASDTEKRIIRLWLDEDAAHQQQLLKERAFFDAMMLADEKQVIVKCPRFNPRKLVMQSMKWAAIILVAFLSSYFFFENKYSPLDAALNIITVPPGQRVNLSLSDGTKVCLNAGSTFTYPSCFAGDMRQVKLDGEAYFEVTSSKHRPFVVQTHSCNVEVLGTKFNVDAYSNEHAFSAALMEGRIKVQNNSNPSNVIYLNPNNQVTLSSGRLAVSSIADYDVYRWKEGLICFKNQNLVDLMKRIEKCYGIDLVIQNPLLSKYSFSGKFRISDGIENLLRVLQQDASYHFTRSEDGHVIYIK